MGWAIVRQPNGLLARFTTVVDDFTDYDMTRREAVADCESRGMSTLAAEEKVARGERDEPAPPWVEASGRADGLDRFRAALLTVYRIHGRDTCRERKRDLTRRNRQPEPER